jgi:hypothetical protein
MSRLPIEREGNLSGRRLLLAGLAWASLLGCASAPITLTEAVGPLPPALAAGSFISGQPAADGRAAGAGVLLVSTPVRTATAEQSEYPVHTSYSIFDGGGRLVQRVENHTGPFGAEPRAVSLAAGQYRVQARTLEGARVMLPVVIAPEATTVVDLDGSALQQMPSSLAQQVRLPDGHVVGWRAP